MAANNQPTALVRETAAWRYSCMRAILLPGSVMPASIAYADLLAAFGPGVDARAKELEVYSGETVPPPDYSLMTEIDGVDRFADASGLERFHLVGYSGGGASALAYATGR